MKTINRILFAIFLISLPLSVLCIEHDFKGFDDSIIFTLNWPGPKSESEQLLAAEGDQLSPSQEILKVTSNNKENYECHLPNVTSSAETKIEDYEGPSPLQLLKPLFSQKICSYRLESYWSYEVCHGRYIRQYHEDRDGKKVKVQEFYLGRWSNEKQTEFEGTQEKTMKPRTTKIDGVSRPYLEIEMDEGTICDLSGKPRLTRVQYVCYSHGKHEVYSFKETSTCEYEILILSPLLCVHPQYKPKETSENEINCFPLDDAPKKPRSLLALEAESLKLHHQTVRLAINDNAKDVVAAVLKVEAFEKDGQTQLKLELHPIQDENMETARLESVETIKEGTITPIETPAHIADDSPVRAFLNGENCLHGGGPGWWKYEFCYGQHVQQYHVDRAGVRTTVNLGRFDENTHLEWLQYNKAKAPKPVGQRTSISHFYANGDICEETGRPRQTEVKLKCLENSSSAGQVSIYLLEPRTCVYILGVESPLICDILPLADEFGLVKMNKALGIEGPIVKEKSEDTKVDKKVDDLSFAND